MYTIKQTLKFLGFIILAAFAGFASGNIYNAILIHPALSTLAFFAAPIIISGVFFALAVRKESSNIAYIGYVLIAAATLTSFVIIYKTEIKPSENGIYNAEANYYLNKNNLAAHDQMRFKGILENPHNPPDMTYAEVIYQALNNVGKEDLIFEGEYEYQSTLKIGNVALPLKLFKMLNPSRQTQTLYPAEFDKKLFERQLCYLEKWNQASTDQKTNETMNENIAIIQKFLKKRRETAPERYGNIQIARTPTQSCTFADPMEFKSKP